MLFADLEAPGPPLVGIRVLAHGFDDFRTATLSEMTDDGTLTGGMLPKVHACMKAIEGGVAKAHIIDGRIPHCLLLEIFTKEGIGTEIQA